MLIGVVSTGGTISGLVTDGVVQSPADRDVPTWLAAEFDAIDWMLAAPLNAMSEDLAPADWLVIADAVRALVAEGADGVVVLHGTDTMAFTSAALAILLDDLPVPVVLTGARLPGAVAGSDASTNVRAALRWLADAEAGVFVVFAGITDSPAAVYLGTHVRKVRASGSAYASALETAWASVAPTGEITRHSPATEPPAPRDGESAAMGAGRTLSTALLIRVYPGIDFLAHQALVQAAGTTRVVLELFPSGTAPTSAAGLDAFVDHCRRSGVLIAAAAPSPLRGAHFAYDSSRALSDLGVHVFPEQTPELLYAKAVLAAQGPPSEVVAQLARTCRTERLVPAAP